MPHKVNPGAADVHPVFARIQLSAHPANATSLYLPCRTTRPESIESQKPTRVRLPLILRAFVGPPQYPAHKRSSGRTLTATTSARATSSSSVSSPGKQSSNSSSVRRVSCFTLPANAMCLSDRALKWPTLKASQTSRTILPGHSPGLEALSKSPSALEGLQGIFYNMRNKTRVMADHHANLGRTIDTSIMQHV